MWAEDMIMGFGEYVKGNLTDVAPLGLVLLGVWKGEVGWRLKNDWIMTGNELPYYKRSCL